MPRVVAPTGTPEKRSYQQLSCYEAGQFDRKRQLEGAWHATAWAAVCKDRAARGVSRRARIRIDNLT